jgi:hypothetical protein
MKEFRSVLHPLFMACDRRRSCLHSAKFAWIATNVHMLINQVDKTSHENRLTTNEEVEKWRAMFRIMAKLEKVVVSYNRENYIRTLTLKNADWVINKIDTFRQRFNSLAVGLRLCSFPPLPVNSDQFMNDDKEDMTVIIRELKKFSKSQLPENIMQQRVFELNLRLVEIRNSRIDDKFISQEDVKKRLKRFSGCLLSPSEFRDDGKLIGAGAQSEVHLGVCESTGESVAIKMWRTLTTRQLECFERELEICSRFKHPALVPFIGIYLSPNLSIVTEFMCGGSLYDRLHNVENITEPLSATQKTIIAMGIAHGMEYLHSKRVIHRDLKSSNILLDEHMYPRIGDFGLSRGIVMSQSEIMTQGMGTCRWMAPEVIRSERYDQSADVYSFAIVLWELLTHKIPFGETWDHQLANQVVLQGYRPAIPENCPARLAEIIQACWDGDPKQRPASRVICQGFDNGVLWFEGTDQEEVGSYLDLLRGSTHGKESLLEVFDQMEFDDFVGAHGQELSVILTLDLLREAQSSQDQFFSRFVGIFDDFICENPELVRLFLKDEE